MTKSITIPLDETDVAAIEAERERILAETSGAVRASMTSAIKCLIRRAPQSTDETVAA